jgi:hypothetical protein
VLALNLQVGFSARDSQALELFDLTHPCHKLAHRWQPAQQVVFTRQVPWGQLSEPSFPDVPGWVLFCHPHTTFFPRAALCPPPPHQKVCIRPLLSWLGASASLPLACCPHLTRAWTDWDVKYLKLKKQASTFIERKDVGCPPADASRNQSMRIFACFPHALSGQRMNLHPHSAAISSEISLQVRSFKSVLLMIDVLFVLVSIQSQVTRP